VCAFLVAHPGVGFTIPGSTVAQLAGRPDALVVREDLTTPENNRAAAGRLTAVGWTETEVPPFYTLYEPPGHPFGTASARRIWGGRTDDHGRIFSDGFDDRNLPEWTTSGE
jgi:hypothetical protein